MTCWLAPFQRSGAKTVLAKLSYLGAATLVDTLVDVEVKAMVDDLANTQP